MKIPTDYLSGYEIARTIEPDMASNYIAHMHIGDPQADKLIEHLHSLRSEQAARLIEAGINQNESALRDAPPSVHDFFQEIESTPHWVDLSYFTPGIRMFHRNSRLILGAFVGGTLVEGFSTNISKSFFITGRLRDQGVRRLKQNNRHMIEIFLPGGLERVGDGWKLSVRIRLVHAQIRYLLKNSDSWDTEAWGTPISSAHLGFSIAAFSARVLYHLKRLGGTYSDEEGESFMAVWRYAGHLMGIPETILYRDEAEAWRLFRAGKMCEPVPDLESIAMANSLINSAPLVIGVKESSSRRNLAKYVFKVSRALIGNSLADQLMYPKGWTVGILALFRIEQRYRRVVCKVFSRQDSSHCFARFTALLEASYFDEAGITWQLPDHVFSEKSTKW